MSHPIPACSMYFYGMYRDLNGGITMCFDTYYDINSVRQHNCFIITQGNYIGYMFRLCNSHLQAYSLQVVTGCCAHTGIPVCCLRHCRLK